MEALPLLAQIGGIVGPIISSLEGVNMSDDVSALAPAFGALSARLKPEEFKAIARALLSSAAATVDNKQIPLNTDERINLAFAGNPKAMFGAMRFAFEVNYAGFFEGLGDSKAEPSQKENR
jgi:hypothetical protein